MDYTTHFDRLLRASKLTWSAVDLPRSTLQGCRDRNTYTIAQIEKIAEALKKQPWEILRPDDTPPPLTHQQLLDTLETNLVQMLEQIHATRHIK